MANFEDLKTALAPDIAELKAALADKKRADTGASPASGMSTATQKYLGLQIQLDQKLRKRGLKGAELDVALKAIMDIVQS